MKIEANERDGIVLLKLAGHMDLGAIGELKDAFAEWRKKGRKQFVLNLIDVNDLSSTGISLVLGISRDLEMSGGELVLAEPSAVVEYVLDLARLDDVFPIYPTEKEAFAHFQ